MYKRMPAKYYIPRLIIITGILVVLFPLFSEAY